MAIKLLTLTRLTIMSNLVSCAFIFGKCVCSIHLKENALKLAINWPMGQGISASNTLAIISSAHISWTLPNSAHPLIRMNTNEIMPVLTPLYVNMQLINMG